jgi:hypothetical protein
VREGATADYIRWRAALALGEDEPSAAALDSLATETIAWIGMNMQDDGVAFSLGDRAIRLREARPGTREERFERHLSVHAVALNTGRPREAAALSESGRALQPDSSFHLRLRVLSALYGDGDRLAATRAAEALGATRAVDPTRRLSECVLEQWRLLDAETADAAGGIVAPTRSPASNTPSIATADGRTWRTPSRAVAEQLCNATVDALIASRRGEPSARRAIERLADLYGAGPVEFFPGDGHIEYVPIVLARLLETSGDHAGALSAIRRRPYFIGWQPFLAASLRYEGRLATLVGDRDGAARAYEHYLALRYAPEPELRAATDSVRAELSSLRAAK